MRSSIPTLIRIEVVVNSERLAGFRGDARVSHDRRMFDQGFDSAEAFAKSENLHALKETTGFIQPAFDKESDHSAKAGHLLARDLVLRMGFEARINHAFDLGMLFQNSGRGPSRFARGAPCAREGS